MKGCALVGVAVFLIVSTASAEIKVGVVDVQGAIIRTEQGMAAANTLKNYQRSRQADLDRRQKRLRAEEDDIRKQARVLTRRALARRTEHWQRRVVDVQSKFIEYNKGLTRKQQNLMQPIMQKMVAVIKRVAQKKGFDIVVDRGVVPFSRTDLDLTELVVQMYNSGGGGGEKKKKADPK